MNPISSRRRPSFVRVSGLLAVAALLLISNQAGAVINAGLQPYDLFQSRYDRVLILQIE